MRSVPLAAHREPAPEIEIAFKVTTSNAPALRSAIDELSTILGKRLEGVHKYTKEAALTKAAIAVGALRAAVSRKCPIEERDYV